MKIAACVGADNDDPSGTVYSLLRSQQSRDTGSIYTFAISDGAIGCMTGPDRFSSVRMMRQSQGNLLLVSGVPVLQGACLNTALDRIVESDFDEALKQTSLLDGAFAALIWSAVSQRLGIVTDVLGMQPLYLVCSRGGLLCSSDIRALTITRQVACAPDPAGWGAFFSFGHFIGNGTAVKAVTHAAPAQIYVYDPRERKLTASTYYSFPAPRRWSSLEQVNTGDIVSTLRASIDGYLAHTRKGTVLLSGGFDSRLILTLLREAGERPSVLIADHRDEMFNADARFACRLARKWDLPHERGRQRKQFFGSHDYVDYLVMNELATPSLYLYISQLASFVHPGMHSFWEGVAPGYLLTPVPGTLGDTLTSYVKAKCQDRTSATWQAVRHLFSSRFADEMYESFRDVLKKEQSRYPDDGAGIKEFSIRNSMRHRTGPNPLKVYANAALPFTPGLTRDFLSACTAVPYELQKGHALYLALYRRHFSKAAEVPFVSSGKLYRSPAFSDCEFELLRLAGAPRLRAYSAVRRIIGDTWWDRPALLDAVAARIDPGDVEWNADAVRSVQQEKGARGSTDALRTVLFYWQMWKWVMSGQVDLQPGPVRNSLPLCASARDTTH